MTSKVFLYFICAVSAMGGLLFGYDWVVIGGAKPFYEQYFGIAQSPVMQGVAMTTALVGCLVGAMVAGAAADKYGRRPLLQMAAVLFTVSAIGTGLFNNFTLFNIARFVGGIGIGLASALAPMYIAEVSPANIRGRMVSLNQMTIVLGILAAQLINMMLAQDTTVAESQQWNVAWGWRWMFWAETVPAALFLTMSFFIPESPRWQVLNQQTDKARKTFARMGGSDYADSEINNVMQTAACHNANEQGGLGLLFSKPFVPILVLGIVVAVFQQWCGTNGIFNYAEEVFKSAGYNTNDMFFQIVLTGIVNVVFTIVALYAVERLGRRSLMLIGACGLFMIYTALGACYFFNAPGVCVVVLVLMAIACYAMSLAPVTWVLLAEIFPNRVRGIAMAVCTFALWAGCCTFTFSFPLLHDTLHAHGQFWLYAVICLSGFIYFLRRCPETKGKSLEELEREVKN